MIIIEILIDMVERDNYLKYALISKKWNHFYNKRKYPKLTSVKYYLSNMELYDQLSALGFKITKESILKFGRYMSTDVMRCIFNMEERIEPKPMIEELALFLEHLE